MKQLHFGNVTVDRVVEAEGLGFPPDFLLPGSSVEAVLEHRDWILPHFFDAESERFIQAIQAYVIRTPHHTILMDTCVGNDKNRPSTKAWHRLSTPFLEKLAKLGVHPEAVDYVMCTHLHVDHVGWNTRLEDGRWVPTFPNAKYLFHKQEYAWWEENGDYVAEGRGGSDGFFEDSVLPVVEAGQAVFVGSDFELDGAITLDPTPGHSPGHVCINLNAGGEHVVFAGDLMHHPVQCARPEWNSRFCWDPEMSRAQRERFVERYAGTGSFIMPAHFATPVIGRIGDDQGTGRFVI